MDTMDAGQLTCEMKHLTEMRESVYRLLSSLYFKELTIDQIRFFAEQDFEGLRGFDSLVTEGASKMKRALRRANAGTREDLAVDYAHTFLAAGSSKEESRACPYESVFTSRDGLIMQEARDDVYRYMLAEHVCPQESLRIPEDHIAFVFEFMAILCGRFNNELERGAYREAFRLLDVQRNFFEKHIESWIGKLCDAIDACCRTDFYRGVSEMTRGFVRVEHELLDGLGSLSNDLSELQM